MSYIYDLHVHSNECSGCAATPAREMVKACKEAGYSGFVLTNHFLTGNNCIDKSLSWEEKMLAYWNAYLEAKDEGDRCDFDVLFGIEHHYGKGREMLIYGIDYEFLVNNPDLCDITPEEICDRVHKVGGFVSHAHPFRERGYIPHGEFFMDFSYLDAMEVYNGANREDEDVQANELCESLNLAKTAGSDLHWKDHIGLIPSGGMEFDRRIRNSSELVSALKCREGRVWHKGERYFK